MHSAIDSAFLDWPTDQAEHPLNDAVMTYGYIP